MCILFTYFRLYFLHFVLLLFVWFGFYLSFFFWFVCLGFFFFFAFVFVLFLFFDCRCILKIVETDCFLQPTNTWQNEGRIYTLFLLYFLRPDPPPPPPPPPPHPSSSLHLSHALTIFRFLSLPLNRKENKSKMVNQGVQDKDRDLSSSPLRLSQDRKYKSNLKQC